MVSSPRQMLGALIYDVAAFLLRTYLPTKTKLLPPWAWNKNRQDKLIPGPDGEGICCPWEHTRDLHVAKVFPVCSTLLLKRMLRDWPIALVDYPQHSSDEIDVSFIIGHRGLARLPHLLLTLKSIAAQRNASIECIVVEQSYGPEIREKLPGWVRYVHTQTASVEYLYNRSWTLNEGVRNAKGKVVVLHDNDMLVPQDYASEFVRLVSKGFEVVNLKRFIANLDQPSSKHVFYSQLLNGDLRSESILQNATAGGSIGILKSAYEAIGGMDEDFVGWGGEDTEFWDRCQTLQVANYCYMPIIHLWHISQPGKAFVRGLGTSTADIFESRMKISTSDRIRLLKERLKTKVVGRTSVEKTYS